MVSGGFDLGTAYGAVVISTDGIENATREAQSLLDGLVRGVGNSLQELGESIANIGQNLTLLTSPIAAFGATGLRAAASFEGVMTEISARTGIMGEDLQAVAAYAQEMGASTVFSAQEAGEALLQLLSSGQTLEEAMSTLPSVMQAAAASGEDLGMTADMVTNVMASFQLGIDRLTPSARDLADQLGVTNEELYAFGQGNDPGDVDTTSDAIHQLATEMGMTNAEFYSFVQRAEDSTTVVESLARGAGASSASIGSLGQGLANVGPVAAQFGMSVDETVATLAIFAENGIAGAEAGTMLKSMLLQMSSDTDAAQGAWRALGVSLYDADGNVRDLNTVMFELDNALDQLPMEEQNQLTDDLAGAYGIVGFNALRAGVSIGEMQEMMTEQASAASVADTMMGTFTNTVGSLQGSVESLQIAALMPFMQNVLQPIVVMLTDVVNAVTAWVNENPELVAQIVRVLAIIVAAGPVLFGLGKGISLLGGLLTSLASPIGLVITAISALWLAWETNFLGIRDLLQPVIDTIVNAFTIFQTTLESGKTPFNAFMEVIRQVFGEEVAGSIGTFIANLQTGFAQVVAIVQPIIDTIVSALSGMFNAVSNGNSFFTNLYILMTQLFGTEVAGQVLSFAFQVAEALGGMIAFFQTTVLPALQVFLKWFISEGMPLIVSFVTDVLVPAIAGFIDTLIRVWNDVSPFLFQLLDWFISVGLPILISFVNDVALPVIQTIITLLTEMWTTVQPFLQMLYDWFITTGLPFVMQFVENAGTIIQGFIDIISGIWAAVSPGLTLLYDGFTDIFGGILNDIIQPVLDAFTEISRGFLEIQQGVGNVASGAGNFLQSAGNWVGGALNSVFGGGESHDTGGTGLAGVPALIGPTQVGNEAFIPGDRGTFYPDLRQTITGMVAAALGGGGGNNFGEGAIIIYANNPVEAADAFNDEVNELTRGRGSQ